MRSPVLGIDLGTTNSVVAVADATEVRVLADEDGHHLTPSVVSFHPTGEVLVGHGARERRLVDATNTISSVKRLIGRPYRSAAVRRAADRFAFHLSESESGGVLVHARGQSYSLPEISAFVLRRIKGLAERALGVEVSQAVVTVPANFNELQRTATRDAGRIAGLEVLRIINEPTAAALAYGYGTTVNERVAVYDLGGGTFDVSILDLSGDVIEVLATAGDTYLGGDDIDGLLADRMVQRFLEEHRVDLATDAQANERLRMAAEWLKCQLSEREQAQVTIEEIAYGPRGKPLNLDFSMTVHEMEQLAFPLLGRTFDICEEALKTAGLRPSQLDSVILVGGQTRMPQIRKMVAEYFGREPLVSVDPDEVVAQGAALQAYALSGLERPRWKSKLSQPPPSTLAGVSKRPSFFPEAEGTERSPAPSTPPRHVTLPPPPRVPEVLPRRAAQDAKRSTLSGVGKSRRAPEADPFAEITTVQQGPGKGPRSTIDFEDEATELHSRRSGTPREQRPLARVSLKSTPQRDAGAPTPVSEAGEMVVEGPGAPTAPGKTLPSQPAPAPGARAKTPPPVPPAPPPAASAPAPAPAAAAPAAPVAALPAAAAPSRPGPAPTPDTQAGEESGLLPAALMDEPGTEELSTGMLKALAQPEPAPSEAPSVSARPPVAPGSSAGPLLLDVTPHTLGIETVGGYCEQIIERNAPIPTEQERVFSTSQDNQVVVRMRVCQGEGRRIEENQILGHLELLGLRKAPRGHVRIGVTFMLDADGTLQARAHDRTTGQEHRIRVSLVGALEDGEIVRLRERQAAMYGGG